MRIDKWLKVSRIIKRRETAKDLCADGDVFINGKKAKPMSEIETGDELTLILGRHTIVAKILEVRTFAKKEDASKMFEVLSDTVKGEEK